MVGAVSARLRRRTKPLRASECAHVGANAGDMERFATDDFALMRRICRAVGLVGLFLVSVRVLLSGDGESVIVIAGYTASIGIFASPEWGRAGGSVRMCIWSALLFGYLGLAAALIVQGPSQAPGTPLILLTPVLIALVLDQRDMKVAAGAAISLLLFVFGLEAFGLTGNEHQTPLQMIYLKCLVIISLLVLQTMILGNFARKTRLTNLHLAQAHEAAKAASLAKSQFLATASHELRTPLNGVIGMSQILLTTDLKPQQRKLAEIVDGSAVSLYKILNDVFDATEINAGVFSVATAPFDVEALVQRVVEDHEQIAWDKGLGLKLSIDRAARGRYFGDAQRITQVLSRLMENAVKFTDSGAVTLCLSRSGKGETEFRVVDAGPGLSEEDQALIFNLFQQADQSETRRFGGLGLGLANARTLAELMGGALSVRSKPGEGATFTLSLPLRRAADRNLKAKLAI